MSYKVDTIYFNRLSIANDIYQMNIKLFKYSFEINENDKKHTKREVQVVSGTPFERSVGNKSDLEVYLF